jgi:hypothetical protein
LWRNFWIFTFTFIVLLFFPKMLFWAFEAFKLSVAVLFYAVTFNLTGEWIKYWPEFWIFEL